tara:strand:- start:111 stop:332 length:222 start_codon:yes stop_codon:yes gene_type:complete
MKEYIWLKHSKNRNSIHKRNKKISKTKLDLLLKDGWVQIVGEVDGVMDRTIISKPKPKTKPKAKPKAKKGSKK